MPPSDTPQMRVSTSPPPNLLQYCQKALHNFLTTTPSPRFQIVHTTSTRNKPLPFRPQSNEPQTIAILDSSFNPPTRAHLSLATSILHAPADNDSANNNRTTTITTSWQRPRGYGATRFYTHPTRLLLLFSTHNADKDPAPAAFEHRLALMILFAHDIVELYTSERPRRQQSPNQNEAEMESLRRSVRGTLENTATDNIHISDIGTDTDRAKRNSDTETYVDLDINIDIDVALTSEPFYSDKSAAISASGIYDFPSKTYSESTQSQTSPTSNSEGKATHIHLLGHDTFLRILTPRYYSQQGHDPPLSALADFFSHHGLRVTLRASSAAGAPSDPSTNSERHADPGGLKSTEGFPRKEKGKEEEKEREKEKEAQLSTWRSLAHGSLEHLGGRREWSRRIEVVDPEAGQGVEGMSSTVVRRAVERGEWSVVEGCCTPGVVGGIRDWGLYRGDDGGCGDHHHHDHEKEEKGDRDEENERRRNATLAQGQGQGQ